MPYLKNPLLIPDLANIILGYVLTDITCINIKAMKKSFEEIGDTLQLVKEHRRMEEGGGGENEGRGGGEVYQSLGRVQRFKIDSIEKFDDNFIEIKTTPLLDPNYRTMVKLNTKTTKQLYKTLLNMHGLDATIKVTKNVDKKFGTVSYITEIYNISPIMYSDLELPETFFLNIPVKKVHPESKFKSLRDIILNKKHVKDVIDTVRDTLTAPRVAGTRRR